MYQTMTDAQVHAILSDVRKRLIGDTEIEYLIVYRVPVLNEGESIAERLDTLREDGSAEVVGVRLTVPNKKPVVILPTKKARRGGAR